MIPITKTVCIENIYSAFEKNFEPSFKFKGERHNFWELVYVIDGVIGVAEDEKIYELKKGDIVFHMPMEFHRIWSEKGTSPRVLIMSFTETQGRVSSLGEGVFKVPEELSGILFEARRCAQICAEYDDSFVNQLIANNLERFIIGLMQTRFPVQRSKKTIGTANYKKIIDVMDQNINRSLNSEQIAHLCGMSLSNLKKTFKQYSGLGVMDYFNRLKMTRAAELLQRDYSVSQVSDMLGFSSSSYFLVAFKRYFFMSPTKYKKVYSDEKMIYKD